MWALSKPRSLVVQLVCALFFVALLSTPGSAAAQATNAGIVGVVTDGTSASAAGSHGHCYGAGITGSSVVTVTDEKGSYRLSPLPTGTYTVTYELAGFQTVRRENVRLAVGFVATLDQAMGLGTVQETVTVSGQSPLVDVTNPSTSVDLSSQGLEILPTTTRRIEGLHGASARHAHESGRRCVQHDRHHRHSGRSDSRAHRGRCWKASCLPRLAATASRAHMWTSTRSNRRASRRSAAARKCQGAASSSTRWPSRAAMSFMASLSRTDHRTRSRPPMSPMLSGQQAFAVCRSSTACGTTADPVAAGSSGTSSGSSARCGRKDITARS